GEKNTVFVALDNGHFEPREVTLGPRGDNNTYEVLSGLKEGERVVTSGQFMLDSESQLREAIQKMLNPNASPTPAQDHAAHRPPPKEPTMPAVEPTPTAYVCPMPEHATIKYNHPGKCPICGMTLIPAPSDNADTPSPTPSTTPHEHEP
ncbi:MAG TPA: heavy metal-binding domain-containing protein, partial [Chthoniobacterales bacterium]|nr:heavy metal-binding domain-containing protein [Chthoniobacterales bacterium]